MKKNYLLFITALAFCGSVNAQKLEKPKIDKITGDTTIKTTEERIYTKVGWTGGQSDILYTYAVKIKTGTYLGFHVNVTNAPRSSVFAIPTGAKAYLKLSDGSILTLASMLSQVSNGNVGSAAGMTWTRADAFPFYELTDETKAKLKGASVTMVRLETTEGNKDYDIKEKNTTTISKSIELITTK